MDQTITQETLRDRATAIMKERPVTAQEIARGKMHYSLYIATLKESDYSTYAKVNNISMDDAKVEVAYFYAFLSGIESSKGGFNPTHYPNRYDKWEPVDPNVESTYLIHPTELL